MSASGNASGEISAAQMAAYETTYATKRRAIYRWVSLGREKNAPPPLACPAEMLAWWQRVMTNRPPAKLLAVAQNFSVTTPPPSAESASAATTPPASSPATPSSPTPPPSAPPSRTSKPIDLSSIEEEGFEAQVRRVRIQLTANQRALEEAMADPKVTDSDLQLRQRNVNVTLELLRKCEASLDERREARGDLIDLSDVQEDWGNLLVALAAMRERMPSEVESDLLTARDKDGKLLSFTPAQLAAVRASIAKIREREDTHLRSAKHWKDTDAVERPAA